MSFIDKWKMKEKLDAFARLLEIMDELREKCPWDKNDWIFFINAVLSENWKSSDEYFIFE